MTIAVNVTGIELQCKGKMEVFRDGAIRFPVSITRDEQTGCLAPESAPLCRARVLPGVVVLKRPLDKGVLTTI